MWGWLYNFMKSTLAWSESPRLTKRRYDASKSGLLPSLYRAAALSLNNLDNVEIVRLISNVYHQLTVINVIIINMSGHTFVRQ